MKTIDLLYQLITSLPEDRKIDSYVNKEGENVLYVIAAQKGTLHILEHMVSSTRFDYNYKDRNGNTAIHFAFQNGVLENVKFLLPIAFEKKLWYNKVGKSPLCLAVEGRNYEFVKSIIKYCDENMLLSCCKIRNPNRRYFSQVVSCVELPLIFFLFYSISTDDQATNNIKIIDLICELVIHKGIKQVLVHLKDSHDNTILHYISMCNYNEKLNILVVDVLENSLNKGFSAPLHYACSSPQDWMGIKLFKHDKYNAVKSLSIESFAGTPLILSRNNRTALYFLVAQGAEYGYLKSSCYGESPTSISIGIIVLGNYTFGKTTLIDTLRLMITNKTLGRARDLCANCAWLNKLTE